MSTMHYLSTQILPNRPSAFKHQGRCSTSFAHPIRAIQFRNLFVWDQRIGRTQNVRRACAAFWRTDADTQPRMEQRIIETMFISETHMG